MFFLNPSILTWVWFIPTLFFKLTSDKVFAVQQCKSIFKLNKCSFFFKLASSEQLKCILYVALGLISYTNGYRCAWFIKKYQNFPLVLLSAVSETFLSETTGKLNSLCKNSKKKVSKSLYTYLNMHTMSNKACDLHSITKSMWTPHHTHM